MFTGKTNYNHNLIDGNRRSRIHETTLYMPQFGKGRTTSQILLNDDSAQIINTEYVHEKIDEYRTYIQNKLNDLAYWFDGADNENSMIKQMQGALANLENLHVYDYNRYLATLDDIKNKLDNYDIRVKKLKE